MWRAAVLLFGALTLSLSTMASPAATERAAAERAALAAYLKDAVPRADNFHDRFDAEVWLLDMSGRLKPFIRDPA